MQALPKRALDDLLNRLSSPWIVGLLGALFLVDAATPDLLPLVDEVVLLMVTVLLGRWRMRRNAQEKETAAPKPPPKDVTPN